MSAAFGYIIRMRIITKKDTIAIIAFLLQDCQTNGHGRKKWWANRLGVSQMTLSHWVAGRRKPNAAHLNALFVAYEELQSNREKEIWSNLLWQNYYENKAIAPSLLRAIAQRLMKADGLQSRTLALLSWFFAKYAPSHYEPSESLNVSHWNNRLGWLYESAGLQSGLKPSRSNGNGTLLEISTFDNKNGHLFRSYLERQQTSLGRKWHLYDCPLDEIKEKLNWRQ